jgi:hypothetical protein
MRWEVVGADKQTGEDRTAVVEANSPEAARLRANHRGLLAAEVRPLRDPEPPRPLSPPAAAQADQAVLLDRATCANCGAAIGRLEQRSEWGGHVVCAPCLPKLEAGRRASPPPPEWATVQVVPRPPRKPMSELQVCGTLGAIFFTVVATAGMVYESGPSAAVGYIGVAVSLLVFAAGRIKAGDFW